MRDTDLVSVPWPTRAVVARLFLGRAEAEARAIQTFVAVREALALLEADDVLLKMAERALDEERIHVTTCLRVANRYAGRPLEARWLRYRLVEFKGVSPRLQAVLRVLLTCAFSESTGDAFLAHTLASTKMPFVRTALRRLMTDEVEHARIGWGLLASRVIDDELRMQIGGWLPTLCELNLRAWRARPALPPLADLPDHGCLPYEEVDAVVLDSMSSLILPGFAALGVDVSAAARWVAQASPPPSAPKLDLEPVASLRW